MSSRSSGAAIFLPPIVKGNSGSRRNPSARSRLGTMQMRELMIRRSRCTHGNGSRSRSLPCLGGDERARRIPVATVNKRSAADSLLPMVWDATLISPIEICHVIFRVPVVEQAWSLGRRKHESIEKVRSWFIIHRNERREFNPMASRRVARCLMDRIQIGPPEPGSDKLWI